MRTPVHARLEVRFLIGQQCVPCHANHEIVSPCLSKFRDHRQAAHDWHLIVKKDDRETSTMTAEQHHLKRNLAVLGSGYLAAEPGEQSGNQRPRQLRSFSPPRCTSQ